MRFVLQMPTSRRCGFYYDRMMCGSSAARVDPALGPFAGKHQCLRFVLEIIEDMELITIPFLASCFAFEQKIGCERAVGQTMSGRHDLIAVILLDEKFMHVITYEHTQGDRKPESTTR